MELSSSIPMNSISQHVKPISLMTEKLSSVLVFNPIYINDNNNDFYTSLHHILPGERLLFALIVEQLLIFTQIFNQTTIPKALSL